MLGLGRLWSVADDLTRLTGRAGYIKRSREGKGSEGEAENQSPIVRGPQKIQGGFKGGAARLASEYEGIKSTS